MLPITRRAAFTLAAGMPLMLSASFASAAGSVVKVSLWDKGPDSVMMDDAHMKMMGSMNMDMAMQMAMMGITVDVATVPAGSVTFDVTNDSKAMIHEMVLSPVAEGQKDLPYTIDENKIDEDAAGHLGEVAELEPGKTGSLTVDMAPGTYILYCNIPGHFISGMWTFLTVTQ